MEITAILLNYKRPELMAKLVHTLREQTEPVKIIFVDNGAEPNPEKLPYDRYVRIPWNGLTYIRMFLAFYVDTEWVMYFDDDRRPKDKDFVKDALAIAKQHRGGITGAIGRKWSRTPPYYHSDAYGPCEIIKGFFMLFERSILSRVPISPPMKEDPKWIARLDDIHLSLMSGRGKPIHWADRGLAQRLLDFDEIKYGLTADPEHNHLRDVIAGDYVKFLEDMA